MRELQMRAQEGDLAAQLAIGFLHYQGAALEGYPQDFEEAAKWYRKAAERNVAEAQFRLGFMYFAGQGVPQDFNEALRLFHGAAEQDHALAHLQIGLMHLKGQGVGKNYPDALLSPAFLMI